MAGSFNVTFEEQGNNFEVDYNDGISVVPWGKVTGKPFKTLGKGLVVVDGELQVSVVERLTDLASEYNLTQQAPLRDSPEMTTFLEEFTVDTYSTEIGSGLAEYEITHNLDSQHLILQVWPMYGELPLYTATPLNNNSVRITFGAPVDVKQAVIRLSSVEYLPNRDMVPWGNISDVKYATKSEMLQILDKE